MLKDLFLGAGLISSLSFAAPALARCNIKNCQQTSSETVSPIKPPDFNRLANFQPFGESFTYTPAANLFAAANGGVVAYSSPFSFNVGSGATSTLYIKEDGVVSFGQSLRAGGFTATTDLRSLGVPLIAPFYADLNENSRTAIAAGYSGIVVQQGLADLFPDAAGNYSLAEAKTALRITWYGFDVGGSIAASLSMPAFAQLLLIDEGNGDFDFKIRAGSPDAAAASSPGGGIGGFVFANDYYQYATPYDPGFAGTFSVRNGEIATVSAAVPEPGAWTLIVLGLGVVGAGLRGRGVRRGTTWRPAAVRRALG